MTEPGGHWRPFLTAEWRYLVMLTWEVDRAGLAPLLPRSTEVDLHEGRALASVVAFRFLDTRLRGLAVPGHRDFDEVNLRFYVRGPAGPEGDPRPGVTFVRELVPRVAIAAVARLLYQEPYRAVPMWSEVPPSPKPDPGRLRYGWRTRAGWQRVAVRTTGPAVVPAPGSLAAFLTGRGWGYTRQRDGGTVEYPVTHPPWRVWPAEDAGIDLDPGTFGDRTLAPGLAGPPRSVLVAEGSAVAVGSPRRLPPRRG